MITLYLDNFRGFRNTTLPLSHVNFLVGENSTGKSSVLGLINLLVSPEFWLTQNFNLPEHEFGGFRDILSTGCDRGERFTIGAAGLRKNREVSEGTPTSYILSYDEQDSLPRLSLFARLDGSNLMALRRFSNKYLFRTDTVSLESISDVSMAFELLTKEASKPKSAFSELPESVNKMQIGPLMIHLLSMSGITGEFKGIKELPIDIPFLGQATAWFAPIRTRPKRTYDGYRKHYSPEGEHTPYLIRKHLDSRSITKTFSRALKQFGAKSGLFFSVGVHNLGKEASSPFELRIQLQKGCDLRINSVGYGVSQALPLVVEMLLRSSGCWFVMQQPEVHLHPRAQAALGDVIYAMAEGERKRFIIETHSDFTIDRFRMNFRNDPNHKTSAQVLFFSRNANGNQIQRVQIGKNGEYSQEQPEGFRNFFLNEQMNLLGI